MDEIFSKQFGLPVASPQDADKVPERLRQLEEETAKEEEEYQPPLPAENDAWLQYLRGHSKSSPSEKDGTGQLTLDGADPKVLFTSSPSSSAPASPGIADGEDALSAIESALSHVESEPSVLVGVRIAPAGAGADRVLNSRRDRVVLVNPKVFAEANADAVAAAAEALRRRNVFSADWARLFRFDFVDDMSPGTVPVNQERIVNALVSTVREGRDACCLAYGANNAGQTRSLFGISDALEDDGVENGLCFTVAKALFPSNGLDISEISDGSFVMRLSALELSVDDSKITDLLRDFTIADGAGFGEELSDVEVTNDSGKSSTSPEGSKAMRIREHPTFGPFVEGLSSIQVESLSMLKDALCHLIQMKRDILGTSSAGHTVVHLKVFGVPGEIGHASAYFVDLAPADTRFEASASPSLNPRQLAEWREPPNIKRVSKMRGRRDGRNITFSTLAVLLKGMSSRGNASPGYPHRQSPLTWLLKGALSSGARAIVLAHVQPTRESYSTTLRMLAFCEKLKRSMGRSPAIHGSPALNVNGSQSMSDTSAEFSEMDEEDLRWSLGGRGEVGTAANKELLKQTVADPQQRLRKLLKRRSSSEALSRQTSTQTVAVQTDGDLGVLATDAEVKRLTNELEAVATDRDMAVSEAWKVSERLQAALLAQRTTENRDNESSQQLAAEIDRLRQELVSVQRERDELGDTVQRLSSESASNSSTKERLGEMVRQIRGERDELERRAAALRDELAMEKGQNTAIRDSHTELRRKLAQAELSLAAAPSREEVERLQRALTEARQAQNAVEKGNEELELVRESLARMQRSNDELRQERTALKGQATRAQQHSERYKEVISRTQAEITRANEEVTQLQGELAERSEAETALKQELEKAAQGVQGELQQTRAEKRTVQMKCEHLEQQIAFLKHDRSASDLSALQSLADVQMLVRYLRDTGGGRLSDIKANIERVQQENARLKTSHLEFETELEKQVKENQALRQRLKVNEQPMADYSARLAALQSTLEAERAARLHGQTEAQALRTKIQHLQGYNSQIEDALAKLLAISPEDVRSSQGSTFRR